MMNNIKHDYIESGECAVIEGKFIPTAKNKPAAVFYESQGFDLVEAENGEHLYRLKADHSRLIDCPGIALGD
jgi:predicted enzyme involved in methoxymalonyl-ACP biosynthesis